MTTKGFLKSGHFPTLFSAFLYFDISFMIWVMLGPLGVHIAKTLELTPAEKGLMVAIPILSGALLRLPLGMLVDSIGPKRTGQIGQGIVIAGLLWAWLTVIGTQSEVFAMGVLLGVAGASFAVALPMASRWYPPEHQGLALGIAGAGNSGTVLAALLAPRLAEAFGWQAVFGLALIPAVITFIAYSLMAKDNPECPPPQKVSKYFTVLREADTWWFCFFYFVTFGGFVGLASSLVIYFHDQYGLTPVMAGNLTALCVFAGSMFRPLGGFLADRIGGIRSLQVLYTVIVFAMVAVSFSPASVTTAVLLFFVGMAAMGMGNGSVFQLVPQRFRKEVGVMTGLVGCTGGIGGFYLASSLGFSKQWTGDYQIGFLIFAGLGILSLVGMWSVKTRWRTTWGSAAVTTARV
ncbi:MAG: NarK/NasA family nitrate transporter, partial [Nitrospirae bacterium]|nr:NarK/NasA family nitrate transporter [Nitrospirota bacterium]